MWHTCKTEKLFWILFILLCFLRGILKESLMRRCTNSVNLRIPNKFLLSNYSTASKWEPFGIHWNMKLSSKIKGLITLNQWKHLQEWGGIIEDFKLSQISAKTWNLYKLQIRFTNSTILQYNIFRHWRTEETVPGLFPFHFSTLL